MKRIPESDSSRVYTVDGDIEGYHGDEMVYEGRYKAPKEKWCECDEFEFPHQGCSKGGFVHWTEVDREG
jgi:hypothetical protein